MPREPEAAQNACQYVDGMYFRTAEEACEWLDFDAEGGLSDADEYDRKLGTEPDRFGEWERWRAGTVSS